MKMSPDTTKCSGTWVATALISQESGQVLSVQQRLQAASRVVSQVLAEPTASDGLIVFPAGWIDTGDKDVKNALPDILSHLVPLLDRPGGQVVVTLGVDGNNGQDQVGLAVTREGVVAIGRKFYPTVWEQQDLGMEPRANYVSGDDGMSRAFTVGRTKFYIAISHDTFGIIHGGHNNPDVDVVISLAHRFGRRGDGSGDVDFARKGLAGVSKQWGCPVFAAANFVGRDIPPNWPSSVL
jgi:hypothetical protein